MKKLLLSCFFLLGLVSLHAVAPVPYTLPVSYSGKAQLSGTGDSVTGIFGETGTPWSWTNASAEASFETAWLRPGKQYQVRCAGTNCSDYWASFVSPDGYAIYIDGQPTNLISFHGLGSSFEEFSTIELRPVANSGRLELGAFTGIQIGQSVTWEMGLGGLKVAGRSAGRIIFKEFDLSNSPASRDRLYYAPPGNYGEIVVVKDGPSNQRIRQIGVPLGVADFVDQTGGYRIDLYAQSQSTWTGSIFTFSGSPWKTIVVESPAADELKITETEGGVSRVSHLSLTSGGSSIVATGGSVTDSGGYRIHTFASSGTFAVSAAPAGKNLEVLVVAGGGGGGGTSVNGGGGGGGGGVVVHNALATSVGSHSVSVGAGGAGGASGSAGGNSSFGGITAQGGGGGGTYGAIGSSGGAGGGSGRDHGSWSTSSATQTNSGGGTGYGTAGGASPYGGYGDAGGGGGAGGAGGAGAQTYGPPAAGVGGGNGGPGIASAITGTSTYYGGGGGGASENRDGGSGGLGGGGNGNGYSGTSTAGSATTGGGGGGGQTTWFGYNAPGQPGGSGIVVVRYDAGIASGNYGWRLQEGNGSTWLRTTTYDSASVSGGREVILQVRTGDTGGTVVAKTKYVFSDHTWGEELTQVIADPDTHVLATTYVYHTSAPNYVNDANRGNYRRVKSVTAPTGGWVAYEYYDDWDKRGQLKYQFEPYVDSPSAASGASTTTGKVTYFEYTAGWSGRHTRPTLREERVNNTVTGRATWSHGDITGSGWPREYSTMNAYRDGSNYQSTYTERYRGDAGFDEPFLPTDQRNADLSRTVFSRANGIYNPSTKSFTVTGGDYHTRELSILASMDGTGAQLVSAWNSQSFALAYLIPNKSVIQAAIFDRYGQVVRTETHVYTGSGNFSLVTSEDFTYNAQGRLTDRLASNNANVTYAYASSGRLDHTTGADGTKTAFTYDVLGRVATKVRKGADPLGAVITGGYTYPAQGDITTTYTYNGLGRVTQEVVSGGALSQTTTRAYDLAGRQTQQVAFSGSANAMTTGFGYTSGGKVMTTTLPGGATRVVETHLDGQVKSVSGSANVSENHNYWIDGGSGKRSRQSVYGGNYSAWTNSAWDWLGRQTDEWAPRWDGNAWGRLWYYNNLGQLWKSTQPGVAAALYEYNTLGERIREGLDINANDVLDVGGTDRIQTASVDFYYNGSAWWVRSQVGTYATASSGAHSALGTVYEQLTGLGMGVQRTTHTYDIFGNATVSTMTVDRTNKLVQLTTDTPDSNINGLQVAHNGLAVESRDPAGITPRAEYDALGRLWKSIDPRKGTTTTAYIPGTNFVSTVTDPASVTQTTYTYDSAGRVASVKNALNKYAFYAYNGRGQKLQEWGDITNPVEYAYNNLGQQTTMKTYRGGSGWSSGTWPSGTTGTADTTTWNYHAPTNLLSSKTDAASKSVTYTYTVAGQTLKRTWARGVETAYGYSSTTGELASVGYSDSTPNLAYTYNRVGQLATVTDQTGTRTLDHCLCGKLVEETLSSFFGSRKLTYDLATTGVVGRTLGYTLSGANGAGIEFDVDYAYKADGRLDTITQGGYPFAYNYVANSHLISSVSVFAYSDNRTYDPNHDWMANRSTLVVTHVVAGFAYGHDIMGRVGAVTKTGEVFDRYGNGTQGLLTGYSYNDRSEITGEVTYLASSGYTILSGRNDAYAYDNIGNRASSTHNGDNSTYTADSRNRYSARTVPGFFDVAGAAASTATVTVNGSSAVYRHGEYFFQAHGLNNTSSPVYANLSVSDGTTTTNVPAFVEKTPEAFGYDDDGNLTSDGRWNYYYDAENRVYWVQNNGEEAAGVPWKAFHIYYDYLGRRVLKHHYSWNAGGWWETIKQESFIYEGWNMIARLTGAATTQTYLWGKDLSGSMQGAGGVGGLLKVTDGGETYLPAYDAMGNVHAMIKSDGSLAAEYEYDAFGRTIRENGPYAASNPFRYSTKYADIETGLIYYGLRYYHPKLGRFINRDPIGEQGGLNLYAFVRNNGVNHWDYLGLDCRNENKGDPNGPCEDDPSDEEQRKNEANGHGQWGNGPGGPGYYGKGEGYSSPNQSWGAAGTYTVNGDLASHFLGSYIGGDGGGSIAVAPNSVVAGEAAGSGTGTPATSGGLTMTVVQAPTQLANGGYQYRVQFGGLAGQSGYVVQHVVVVPNFTDAKGNPANPGVPTLDFYEAWKVENGAFTTGSRNGIDTFRIQPGPPSGYQGSVTFSGRVTFIPNYTLDPKDGWTTGVPSSGGLPATTSRPNGWPTSGTQTHIMVVRFDTTKTPATSSAKSSP